MTLGKDVIHQLLCPVLMVFKELNLLHNREYYTIRLALYFQKIKSMVNYKCYSVQNIYQHMSFIYIFHGIRLDIILSKLTMFLWNNQMRPSTLSVIFLSFMIPIFSTHVKDTIRYCCYCLQEMRKNCPFVVEKSCIESIAMSIKNRSFMTVT